MAASWYVGFPSPFHQALSNSPVVPIPLATFVPGAYAVSIDAKMPIDIVEQLEENRLRMHSVLATAPKADS